MLNRQLVLVAIDDATNMTRAIDVARSVATARGADVDVIRVVPYSSLRVDGGLGPSPVASCDDGSVSIERFASMLGAGDDGVHMRSVTLRGAGTRHSGV